MPQCADFIIISGLSGAGRSTALRAFEDNGYIAIDNLPLSLVLSLRDLHTVPVAVSIDTRSLDFSTDAFIQILNTLKEASKPARLVFLECDESVLLTRFKQTRRPHPLSGKDIQKALREEFSVMRPLIAHADKILNTSHMTPEQTSLWIKEHFCTVEPRLIVQLISFSYRNGLPPQADIIFDGRFLTNPFYEENLKNLTGRDEPVQQFLTNDPLFQPFMDASLLIIKQSLLGFKKRGRSYVTIAVGCTGGRHRSVFMIETLFKLLQESGIILGIEHRELN